LIELLVLWCGHDLPNSPTLAYLVGKPDKRQWQIPHIEAHATVSREALPRSKSF
jgi:hypothetical protein